MHHFKEILPSEEIKPFVKNFWTIEYHDTDFTKDYLLPSTLCYLFYVRTPVDFEAHFVQNDGFFTITNGFHLTCLNSLVEFSHREMFAVGASIYPIYTSLLFKEDPEKLVNKVKKDFDAPKISESSRSSQHLIKEIEQEFLKRINENPVRKEVDFIYKRMVGEKLYRSTVEEIAEWIGYTPRHLSNLFKKHLGLSPKKFFKLIRFNHALELLNETDCNLSDVAYELGYHDQSHFIKDFKSACGKTPKEMKISDESMAKYFTLY